MARSRGGLFVQPPLWLLTAGLADLFRTVPLLVGAVFAAFVVFSGVRLYLTERADRLVRSHPHLTRRVYLAAFFGGAVLWGGLAAASVSWPPLAQAHAALLTVIIGLCSSGTLTLGILPVIRRWMPTGIVLPVPLAMLADFSLHNALFATMFGLYMLYLVKAARIVHGDYWSAVFAREELEARAGELERLSRTDALTGVPNRLHADQRLALEWSRAVRRNEALSTCLVDLDHFKQLNDRHGHAFGDRCLIAAARAMQQELRRPTDVFARWGGEEFFVLLPAAPAAQARQMAERLRAAVAALALESEGRPVQLGCSIGVATLMEGESAEQLLRRADAALYEAKRDGRNRVGFSEPGSRQGSSSGPAPASNTGASGGCATWCAAEVRDR